MGLGDLFHVYKVCVYTTYISIYVYLYIQYIHVYACLFKKKSIINAVTCKFDVNAEADVCTVSDKANMYIQHILLNVHMSG